MAGDGTSLYSVRLFDSGGDGWQGATWQIYDSTYTVALLGGTLAMCNGLQLFTAVESLVATPYAKLEKKVASQQIPAVAAAPAPRKTLASELADGASFDHSAWDALLKAHVRDDGTVDYGGLERDGDAFRGYLGALAAARRISGPWPPVRPH